MKKYDLKFPAGFNSRSQKQVGYFVAQLDDQAKYFKRLVKDLTVKQLEWQPRTGMNTISLLSAHIPLAEVWWINVASKGLPWQPDGEKVFKKVLGYEDDGLPMKPNAKHPSILKGYSAERYLKSLASARRSIKRELKTWHDRDLNMKFKVGKREFSRIWTLYHLVEHISSHTGQILLLKHIMRDRGVLK